MRLLTVVPLRYPYWYTSPDVYLPRYLLRYLNSSSPYIRTCVQNAFRRGPRLQKELAPGADVNTPTSGVAGAGAPGWSTGGLGGFELNVRVASSDARGRGTGEW